MGWIRHNPEKYLARRRITEVPDNLIRSHPIPEVIRMATVLSGSGPIASDLAWERTEWWFDRLVAAQDLHGAAAVYGYEHAALRTFQSIKSSGGRCVYEMPICHHKTMSELLDPEFEKFPQARTSYTRHLQRLAPRRNIRKDAELKLADRIIVNSGFTKRSLINAGVPESKITVIPLGAPPVLAPRDRLRKEPFIFLSAGTQSVRKGTHYLLSAWRRLSPDRLAQLWMVGPMLLPKRLIADLPGTVVIRDSASMEKLSDIYRRSSVLVFPSLCEGFGMVITEAMAHGLPVITTPNTAGPELIRHGENGFIIPIRDADRLAETMQWCLSHPEETAQIGRRAADTAAGWQWADYRRAFGTVLSEFMSVPSSGSA